MRSRTFLILAISALGAAAVTPADQAEPPITDSPAPPAIEPPPAAMRSVVVDCRGSKTIAQALEEPAEELIVEVRGVCQENVVVDRDRVTLRGRNPQGDGIRSASPGSREPTLLIRGARGVTIENLGISDAGWDGLRVLSAHDQIEINNCRLQDNANWGGSIIDSTVTLNGVRVSRNGRDVSDVAQGGLMVARGSMATCNDCSIEANPQTGSNVGAVVYSNSALTLNGGNAEGRIAVLAQLHSSASLSDVALAASEWAFQANHYGNVRVLGGELAGSFLGLGHSTIRLYGATQLENPVGNLVTEASTLLGDDREGTEIGTTLSGLTQVSEFSNGKLLGGTVAEDLVCSLEARVFCAPTTSKRSSNCGLCP